MNEASGVETYLDNSDNWLKLIVCFQDELRIIISARDHLVRAVSGNLKYVLGYPIVSSPFAVTVQPKKASLVHRELNLNACLYVLPGTEPYIIILPVSICELFKEL